MSIFSHASSTHTSTVSTSQEQPHVLLIDDDEAFCLAMSKALRRRHFIVSIVNRSTDAIPYLLSPPAHAVAVLDLKMPNLNGLEVLQHTQKREIPVIMLTGHGAIPDAVKAMQAGAYTFLSKPIDANDLAPVITQAYQQSKQTYLSEFTTVSASLTHLKSVVQTIASTEEPVLINGETGTGKELVARALHTYSARKDHPFVAVNMACLPHELVASELFGHVKGAFTGAHATKLGLFQEVGEGTLFLDEVAELPLEHQAQLLRVIEQREMRPVGASKNTQFKGRLVTATHKNLAQEVEQGRFREDLFYRLQVLPLYIPPLRKRPADIIPIAEVWFQRLTNHTLTLSIQGEKLMLNHTWPGNVREVVNLMRRLAIFYPQGQEITHETIQQMLAAYPFTYEHSEDSNQVNRFHTRKQEETHTHKQDHEQDQLRLGDDVSLEEIERRHIELLLQTHTNISQVARILKINRRTLQRKLKNWGLASDDFL